jgi:hypothetical protein
MKTLRIATLGTRVRDGSRRRLRDARRTSLYLRSALGESERERVLGDAKS